jgi:hypothetical protein
MIIGMIKAHPTEHRMAKQAIWPITYYNSTFALGWSLAGDTGRV